MKTYLIMIMILFNILSFSTSYADDECIDGKFVSSKINNFNEADFNSPQSYKACSMFLHEKDQRHAASLELIVDKKTIEKHKEFLRDLGENPDWLKEQMKDSVGLSEVIETYSFLAYPAFILFLLALIIIGVVKKYSTAKSIIAALISGCIFFGIIHHKDLYFYGATYFVASSNFIIYNGGDHDTIKNIKNTDTSLVIPALKQSNLDITTGINFINLINVVTKNEEFSDLWGQHIEIDKPILTVGMDISDPTIEEFFDYWNVCSETSFVVPDDEISLLFSNFNFTKITNRADYVSGATDSSKYNCHKDHFGRQAVGLSVISNVHNVVKNFIKNNYPHYLATDETVLDSMRSSFNKQIGELLLELEKTEDLASLNSSTIQTNLLLAEQAALEVRETNLVLEDTPSYKNLVRINQSKMGNIFDYKQIEGLDTFASVAFSGIKSFVYNYAELYNMDGEDDSMIDDKTIIGSTYIDEYVTKTMELALELECAKTMGSEKEYELRKQYATHFNQMDNDTKLRRTGFFKFSTHCYRFMSDNTIQAGGKFESIDVLTEVIKDRFLALNIFFSARQEAANKLIVSNDELISELALDALNKMSGSLQDSLSTYTITAELNHKLHTSLKAVQDTLTIETRLISFDVTQPDYFYNFLKYPKNAETQIEQKSLNKYDLSEFFIYPATSFVENAALLKENKESSFSKALKAECPIMKDGECAANLLILNAANLTQAYETGVNLGLTDLISSSANGICNAGGKNGGVTFGKSNPFTAVGCAGVGALDSVSDTFVKPLSSAYLATAVVLFAIDKLPTLGDIGLLFVAVLIFITSLLFGIFIFCFEVPYKLIQYILADEQDKARCWNEFISLQMTVTAFKSIVVGLCAVLVSLYFVMSILSSSNIGGSVFDILYSDYQFSAFSAITLFFVLCAVVGWLILATFKDIFLKIYNGIVELFGAKAVSFNSSSFGPGAFIAVGSFAAGKLSSMQRTTDEHMNELKEPKKKNGNGSNRSDSPKPKNVGGEKTNKTDDIKDKLDSKSNKSSDKTKEKTEDKKKESKTDTETGKGKLDKWKDDVDEYHKTKTKTTINRTGEERTKDALKDHYKFSDRNNEE